MPAFSHRLQARARARARSQRSRPRSRRGAPRWTQRMWRRHSILKHSCVVFSPARASSTRVLTAHALPPSVPSPPSTPSFHRRCYLVSAEFHCNRSSSLQRTLADRARRDAWAARDATPGAHGDGRATRRRAQTGPGAAHTVARRRSGVRRRLGAGIDRRLMESAAAAARHCTAMYIIKILVPEDTGGTTSSMSMYSIAPQTRNNTKWARRCSCCFGVCF